ncbi:hypothetical protein H0E87_022286 [Populus deltoides]|uniref:Uncharacterized protein n=1 Tax=Populus deltoides TaxID=3696 RepID=A0A8T2XIY2_POPDE|nr:hypothetical protein H0E87_022286 [Populus deltoides]
MPEDRGCFLDAEEVKMSKIFSAEPPIVYGAYIMMCTVCLATFHTGAEKAVMTLPGNESPAHNINLRLLNDKGWIVNDLMVLHDIPFAYKHLPCTITFADSSSLIGTNKLRMRGY